MKACVIQGVLYAEKIHEGFGLKFTSGEERVYDTFKLLDESEGISSYIPVVSGQELLLPQGRYVDEEGNCVLSVATLRRPIHKTDNDKPLPFTDEVYTVIYGVDGSSNIEINIKTTEVSEDIEKWPKILRDGNTEVFGDKKMTYTYPVVYKPGIPDILSDINEDIEGKIPLKHGTKLELTDNGRVLKSFVWDQLSKIWYSPREKGTYDLIRIKGGRFAMGDYRGKLSNYSFGMHNVNMKKKWSTILDPQYMGETERGAAAIGVTGLKDEDSLAKDKDCSFWCYNDDAVAVHDVELSDFEMGKYQVTMDEFYEFVKSLKGSSDQTLYYDIAGEKYDICHPAGISLFEKMKTVKDNGWGMGQRPAINVSYFEIAEYCNYMSRKEGYDPCYGFKPIYDGEYADGLTGMKLHKSVHGSCMQKSFQPDVKVQLVEVYCDTDRNGYRLPTEAEYEYVIRGGELIKDIRGGKGALYAGINGDSTEYNNDFSWQRKNTDNPLKSGFPEGDLMKDAMGGNGYTAPTGTRLPSQLGLYDLSGNAWDIVEDLFSTSYFEECAKEDLVIDPKGPQYGIEIMSRPNEGSTIAALKDEYVYTYEKAEDGTMTRIGAKSVASAGKTIHTLRGGCFTNPYPFTSALHRHSITGPAFYDNLLYYYNARISFRMVRSIR